ncbi:aspartate kinase [Lacrimispora sp. NSJ-141]|uniref:Aspartokinase n=1 Tax=Lientehia hominis TaxID=2897778 RepID=A0AAP2RK56_9FIRM|nr:aspartate kinase [Lientehia hominis]MCD2493712.1 aspartate kinase [Lientehia hominis]
MLIVKKFGGSSVADKERIFNVARRCAEDYKKGDDVVVVLSAMGKTTDGLIAQAHDINPNPPKREMDMLLATGEQMSVAYMAMALSSMDIPAVSLNAFQVAMHTSSAYMNARLKRIDTERIRNELDARKIVIVTGFQGVNRHDDFTTLGRGGSDTTAVALAAALHADACEIYTDVEGVYTADPRIVPNARKMSEVTYDEMLEFASLGAKVLHNRSVEMAKRYGVQLVVRSSLSYAEGTVVKEETKMEKMIVSGVASDLNTARISVIGVNDEPGIAFKLFNYLAAKNINIDIILQSVARDGRRDIAFTVPKTELHEALAIIDEHKDTFTARSFQYDENVAKVSIIGAGMTSNPGVAAKMFEALYNADINIQMISTSEIRITVLIDENDVARAMRAIHDKFDLGDD